MTISLTNLQYASADNSLINMIVTGWSSQTLPFTYSATDASPLAAVVKTMLAGGNYTISPYLAPAAPVPQSCTRRQMLIGLMLAGYITAAEAKAAATTGAVPALVQQVINGLPDQTARDIATITWASMRDCMRTDPLIPLLANVVNPPLTSPQIDDLFRQWVTL